jgi:adenine/guanine phosphoribosyltransferase-like PRPP-binding protein
MTYLVGMLVVGFVCNLLIRPVNEKYYMTPEELAREKALAHEKVAASERELAGAVVSNAKTSTLTLVLAWTAVGIPLAWGVAKTIEKAVLILR